MKYKNILAIAMATTTMTSFALAQDQNINNKQSNWAETQATLNTTVSEITGDVALVSTAISNSFTADITGGSNINNTQHVYGAGDVTSALTAEATNVVGQVNATSAAIGNSATFTAEGDSFGQNTNINNSQYAHGADITSELDLKAANINGTDAEDGLAVSGLSAAIANSASIDVTGDTKINNFQTFRGNVVSELDADLEFITGDVELSSVAIGNSASINVGDAEFVEINNNQVTNIDPQAFSNINARNIQGDFTSTTAGISNSLTVSTLPETSSLLVNSTQENTAFTGATTDAFLNDIVGSVSVTAAAIGNSVSITNVPEF